MICGMERNMAIRVENSIITILTKDSMYQMKIDKYGVLNHTWYGPIIGQNMDYLLDYPDVGFSGNIYEAENERTYSLNTLPLEYPAYGTGDYRIPAASVSHADGSSALDLRYVSYEIRPGKYRLPLLPAAYGSEEEAQTLEIVLKDTATEVYVHLLYGVFADKNVITRSVRVENCGKTPIRLEKVHSLSLDLPADDWEWVHFHGRHTMERQPERSPLLHGIQESSSTRGTSSHQQNPTVLLCKEDCTEDNGFCIGAALMYSGGFQTQIEKDQLDQVRLVMGIDPSNFAWQLESGDSFYAPEVLLSCSNEGFAKLSQQFHTIIRRNICRGKYQLSARPVLINNWEATYFDFNEEKIEKIAKQASELGIDMMVLDDGWFGKRDSDYSGLGDWKVNETKLKGGLAPLVQKVNQMNMKFGLWFEPEMISEDSDLYRQHPEWAIKIPGRKPMRSRYQLVLDMTRADVLEYLYQTISEILRSNRISYVKWDMNRHISDWYTATLPADRQKEMPHRYVLGLYWLLERLTEEFPEVLFEGCSGGGGRFDAGMLYYCPQIWCSDNTDAHERCYIQYGTSFFYPISAVGSHVSAVPNHQTGRTTSLRTRAVVAMAGSFGYELDLNTLTEEEKDQVKAQVAHYKEMQNLIYNGAYYRLSDPNKGKISAWSFVADDGREALIQGVIFRAASNVLRNRLRLAGLKKDAYYRVKAVEDSEDTQETVLSGNTLMQGGVLLPRAVGDDYSFEFYLEEV